ncbi:MAG TPA: ABC transporter substrate-binding protein [Acidimicrobiales bacterium]|nr:ABC transporter substrate-binding protein [Acidimicrobiales bacterium]
MTGNRRKLPGADGRPLKGYAPLAALAVVFVLVIALLPSSAPAGVADGDAVEVAAGQTATGWGETVTACPDRQLQVEGDGYSPPCFAFSGDNGGATTRGVTADEITVSFRVIEEPNLISVFASSAGLDYDESNEDLARTVEGLVDYFNDRYQMYGRRLTFERIAGTGSLVSEVYGAGQAEANSDAIAAATEVEAFADVSALSQPYADALARQHVMNFGAPFLSREWFVDRRPYSWSLFTDCTVIGETGTEYALNRLLGRPAEWAGGDLQGQDRRVALIAPDNPEYQQCVAASEEVIREGGEELDLVLDYNLNIANLAPQASTLLARLRDADITTVSCTCDPLMVLYLTQEAESQGYQPEWQVLGTGFTDLDLVGQAYAQGLSGDQWSRAFGLSYFAEQQPFRESAGYRAYSEVRDDQPSQLVDILYYQLQALVIGIQMAGPNLTPETFETGMFAYPGGTGSAGTWDFFPEHYSPQVDAREVWFDTEGESGFNGEPGTYASNGTRYRQGEWPEGEPEVFP